LYRWNPPTLSLGRNEPLDMYDRDAIEARGIAVVRRPTGGKAVWHEHELTYAVAAPISAFGSLRDAYCAIQVRLAEALQSLGVGAILAPARPPVRPSARPAACFDAPAGGEILAQGRKLVGSAQVRRGKAFLQHGSILLDGSQEIVRAVSRRPAGVGGETTLATLLGRPVSFEELSAAIIATWGESLSPSARPAVRPSAQQTWRR
jgi:lipoate-protein ligase A